MSMLDQELYVPMLKKGFNKPMLLLSDHNLQIDLYKFTFLGSTTSNQFL